MKKHTGPAFLVIFLNHLIRLDPKFEKHHLLLLCSHHNLDHLQSSMSWYTCGVDVIHYGLIEASASWTSNKDETSVTQPPKPLYKPLYKPLSKPPRSRCSHHTVFKVPQCHDSGWSWFIKYVGFPMACCWSDRRRSIIVKLTPMI